LKGVKNAPRGLLLSGTPPVRIRAGTPQKTPNAFVFKGVRRFLLLLNAEKSKKRVFCQQIEVLLTVWQLFPVNLCMVRQSRYYCPLLRAPKAGFIAFSLVIQLSVLIR
jgi:hypothetical protein